MFGFKSREELWDDPVGNNIKGMVSTVEQSIISRAESVRSSWYKDMPSSLELDDMLYKMDAYFLRQV